MDEWSLDWLCGQNQDPQLRRFAIKCWNAAISAATNKLKCTVFESSMDKDDAITVVKELEIK